MTIHEKRATQCIRNLIDRDDQRRELQKLVDALNTANMMDLGKLHLLMGLMESDDLEHLAQETKVAGG